jgi:glycosyltransferase involved in cell wall biosynthesis
MLVTAASRRGNLRILHVNTWLGIGGAERIMIELARQQRLLGHDAQLCTLYGEGPLDASATAQGIPVIHLNTGPGLREKVKALTNLLKREKFDVLHSHWGVWLPLAIAGFGRKIPVVHTNHGNESRRDFWKHRVASALTGRVVELTPTPDPYIQKWVGVPARKTRVVPNGVDFARLEEAGRVEIEGIPAGASVVGMVARLSIPKDVSTFLRAAAQLERTHPDVHFVSVGTGKLKDDLVREARELQLKRFHFLGARDDIPALMRRMTVHVLSTRNEGQGIVLIEAMVSGCACVATDLPPVRFTLEDGKSGVLVPVGDAEALAAGIERLLLDAELRAGYVARGKDFVQQFRSSAMAERYLGIYAEVAGSG